MSSTVQAPSGNHGGKIRRHLFIIMHYTASDSAAGSIAWLRTPAAQASAHVVIDQAGLVTQLVPFDTVAWHCGPSKWGGERHLNQTSIGIELVNPGPVSQLQPGTYGTRKRMYAESEVLHADGRVWAKYPDAQLEAAAEVVRHCFDTYGPMTLLGHSDVCDPPGRKQDPGPAFPWDEFKARVTSHRTAHP